MKKYKKNILDYSHDEAKDFFIKNESYCSTTLPKYFDFSAMLKEVDIFVKNHNPSCKAENCEYVNYSLVVNKDSKYSWRQIQLINPILYIKLVNTITEKEHWNDIVNRVKTLQSKVNKYIKCISIPVEKIKEKTDTGASILNYWSNFEQKSIELSLEYNYIFATDIANFYPSIYTHSIPWAIHNKCIAKKKRNEKKLIGNKIDKQLQHMQYGQTNGIPEGSILIDFISEILSAYIDEILYTKLEELKITEYKILRYRDDYRIFVKNPKDGEQILKTLSEILMQHGLKINGGKTSNSSDIITNSIKTDKIYSNLNPCYNENIQKYLLNIREIAKKYPNSGSIVTLLSKFFKELSESNNLEKKDAGDINVLIAIVVDIAINNPKAYYYASLILSKLLFYIKEPSIKQQTIDKIITKFKEKPNTGYMEICLQRVVLKIENLNTAIFNEKLCQVSDSKINTSDLWCFDWLDDSNKDKIIKTINSCGIINQKEKEEIKEVAEKDEGEIFTLYY